MKSVWKHLLIPLAAVLMTASGAFAQTTTATTSSPPPVNPDGINFNHPPCDFSDVFYGGDGTDQHPGNGINVTVLNQAAQQRFGKFRQFGPPSTGFSPNWKTDPTCSQNDPTKTNVRILAITAGYSDDGTTTANQFISIIAFLTTPNVFTGVANKRNIQMSDIISNFEAYGPLKQMVNGRFFTQPCGSMSQTGSPSLPNPPSAPLTTNCFPVTSVATPHLRQDWRFATNRNAIDGSDNNDPFGVRAGSPGAPLPFGSAGTNQSPYGYFCDDLLGAWIITYFWFPINPLTVNPQSACGQAYAALAAANGKGLDGTPNIITATDLNGTEGITQDIGPDAGLPCAQEGKLALDGTDGGAIWIICPGILDPRNGAIAPDAFLDHATFPDGRSVDPRFLQNFNCLQRKGQFPGSNDDGTQPTGACNPGSGDL
jgi:hypothetical protein